MKIISKRQAMAIYRQHSESRLFRFCTGKYKWSGSICHYHGREVQDIRGVLAVFAERCAGPQRSVCDPAQRYPELTHR